MVDIQLVRPALLSALLLAGAAQAEPEWPQLVLKIEDMQMLAPLRVSIPHIRARGEVQRATVLRVHVDKLGLVQRLALLQGSGSPSHDEAAMQGMRHVKFAPKDIDGTAVDVTLIVPLHFPLSRNLPPW